MSGRAKSVQRRSKSASRTKAEIGWCELVDLPGLGLSAIHAKMDTGAATSSIHATRVKPFERDGIDWVEFWFRPLPGEKARTQFKRRKTTPLCHRNANLFG